METHHFKVGTYLGFGHLKTTIVVFSNSETNVSFIACDCEYTYLLPIITTVTTKNTIIILMIQRYEYISTFKMLFHFMTQSSV